jgi:lipoprotein-anchoring transpeptidase ErfK/SrfK
MKLSRRTLLKLSSLGLMRAMLPPLPKVDYYTDGDVALPVTKKPVISFARALTYGAIIRSEPNAKAPQVGTLKRDGVLPIYAEMQTDSGSAYNKLWYEVEGGYIYSALAHPVRWQLNKPATDAGKDGFWAEVTVPFVDARTAPAVSAPATKYRYYGGTVYKVIKSVKSQDKPDVATDKTLPFSGSTEWWYQIEDEMFPGNYFVPASQLRQIAQSEFSPLSPGVDPVEKKIVVKLKEQRVSAYERDVEVFSARCATGTYFPGDSGEMEDFTTTPGTWYVFHKTASQHMHGGAVGDSDSYDLPGIPWVSYFTRSGIAIHGTYWHNDFGLPRSHGCVNVRSDDSKWFWRWTVPPNDYKERYASLPLKERQNPRLGSMVVVE